MPSLPTADRLVRSSAWLDGRGVMQVAAPGGMRLLALDEKPASCRSSGGAVAPRLSPSGQRATCRRRRASQARSRQSCHDRAGRSATNIIVEGVDERLDVNQALFAGLDAMPGPDTIIAATT